MGYRGPCLRHRDGHGGIIIEGLGWIPRAKMVEASTERRAALQPALDTLATQYPQLHFSSFAFPDPDLVIQARNADGSLGELLAYNVRLNDRNLHAKLARYEANVAAANRKKRPSVVK